MVRGKPEVSLIVSVLIKRETGWSIHYSERIYRQQERENKASLQTSNQPKGSLFGSAFCLEEMT